MAKSMPHNGLHIFFLVSISIAIDMQHSHSLINTKFMFSRLKLIVARAMIESLSIEGVRAIIFNADSPMAMALRQFITIEQINV
jgi:hypothetical protein